MALEPVSLIFGASYIGIFLIVAFIGYFLPVPEEVLIPAIGYLAYLGVYEFKYAAAAVLAAIGFSDNILFWLSKTKGQEYINGFALRFRISRWQIERAKRYVGKSATLGLSVLRAIPGIKLLGPILAGLSGMSWKRFQFFDLIGASVWVVSLMALGFYFGSSMHSALGTVERAAPFIILLAIFAAAAYVFMNKKKITEAVFRNI